MQRYVTGNQVGTSAGNGTYKATGNGAGDRDGTCLAHVEMQVLVQLMARLKFQVIEVAIYI